MTIRTKRIAGVSLLVVVAAILAAPTRTEAARASQSSTGKVKVFILAGQSNMEGAGKVAADPNRNEGKGSLEYLVKDPATAARFKHTVDAKGKWVVRKDVCIWYLGRKGGLSVGYGARSETIGPEFQFGHVMGDRFDEPVLLIKTAWGGKDLGVDFRPPSSGKITFPMGKGLTEKIAKDPGTVGKYYRDMLQHVRDVLKDLKTNFPDLAGREVEIAGFGWHQGWNDGCNGEMVKEYEKNMANFIRDVRKDLGVKDLPFVIANSGFGGWENKNDRRLGIMNAQLGVAKHKEFVGNVASVETRDFFRPPEVSPSKQGYHWNGNAETYFLIGDAMGKAMVKMLGGAPAGAVGSVPPKAHPDTSGWDDLLKGDLSNAIYTKGVWSFEGGILTATKDINLWTAKQYNDFIVDVEFKTADGTNSGVIVHCSDTKKWIPNSVEIQIADDYAAKWAKAPASWRCGAIFGHLPASRRVVKKPGEWNRYTITCKGSTIWVMLNGETVTVMDMTKWTSAKTNPDGSKIPPWLSNPVATLPLKGHIGFQGKHAGAPIWFRNMKVKELK